jgi:hypothetical protein
MGVKEKPDIIDIIEKKRLQWYGHVKRMPEERIPKLVMKLIPLERRKRGRPTRKLTSNRTTYTSAKSTVNEILMMGRGTARNM